MSIPIDTLFILTRMVSFIIGALVVAAALISAISNLVLPRVANDRISRWLLACMRAIFQIRLKRVTTYEARDRIMAFFAPIYLFTLAPLWLTLVLSGYMGMFWAIRPVEWSEVFLLSGSSLLTLGFAPVYTVPEMILSFSEAVAGLILVALLIAYLPAMYGNFARREGAVTKLSVRAGSPPSPVEMIVRLHRIGELEHMRGFWEEWESLFADIEESHSSLIALVFFRSPNPDMSWVTSSGVVMDTAALTLSVVDMTREPKAALCIRAGFLALQRVAEAFSIDFPPDPTYPNIPISITREDFDTLCQELENHGVPLKSDRKAAWIAYAGWRVNYDQVLTHLCNLTMAPYTRWSSDRSAIQVHKAAVYSSP